MRIRLSEIKIKYRPDGTVDNQRSDFDPIIIGAEIAAESTKISDDNPYKETLVQVEQDKIAVKYNILPIFTSVRAMGINTVPIMLDPEMYLVTGHVRFACLLGIGAKEAEAAILQHKVSDVERLLLQGAENAVHTIVTPYDWIFYVRRIRAKVNNNSSSDKKRMTDIDIARICGISTSSLYKYTTVGNLGIEAVIERLRPPYNLPFGYVYDFVRQVSKEVQELPEVLELLDRKPLPDVNVMIWDIEQLVIRKQREMGIEQDEDIGRTEITISDTITNPLEVSKRLARLDIPIVRKVGSKFPGELTQMTKLIIGWSGWFRNAAPQDGYRAIPEISLAFFSALTDFLNFLNGKRSIGWRVVWIERTQKFVVRKSGKDEDDTKDDN